MRSRGSQPDNPRAGIPDSRVPEAQAVLASGICHLRSATVSRPRRSADRSLQVTRRRCGIGRAAVAEDGGAGDPAPTSYRQRLFVEHYLGGSSGSAIDAVRELGIHGLRAGAATGLEKSEKRGIQAARNGPSEDRKCWQRVELGIHGLKSWGRNWSRKVRETRNSRGQKRSEPAAMRGRAGD